MKNWNNRIKHLWDMTKSIPLGSAGAPVSGIKVKLNLNLQMASYTPSGKASHWTLDKIVTGTSQCHSEPLNCLALYLCERRSCGSSPVQGWLVALGSSWTSSWYILHICCRCIYHFVILFFHTVILLYSVLTTSTVCLSWQRDPPLFLRFSPLKVFF